MIGLRNSIPKELSRRLIIKVNNAATDDLVKQADHQKSLNPQYAEPWIIFDRDEVKNFDKIKEEADNARINVGWSNPCIEIWFNAYFKRMPTYQTSVECCKGFETEFEKITGKKYKKSDKRIYDILCEYGEEDKAIEIAEKKLEQCIKNGKKKPSERCPATTMHTLIRDIKSKIK